MQGPTSPGGFSVLSADGSAEDSPAFARPTLSDAPSHVRGAQPEKAAPELEHVLAWTPRPPPPMTPDVRPPSRRSRDARRSKDDSILDDSFGRREIGFEVDLMDAESRQRGPDGLDIVRPLTSSGRTRSHSNLVHIAASISPRALMRNTTQGVKALSGHAKRWSNRSASESMDSDAGGLPHGGSKSATAAARMAAHGAAQGRAEDGASHLDEEEEEMSEEVVEEVEEDREMARLKTRRASQVFLPGL